MVQHAHLWINRIGLLVGLILWSTFGVVDRWALPETYQQAWLIRFGLVVPLILLAVVATYLPIYRRLIRPLIVLVTLATGLGVIAIVYLARPGEVGYYYYIFGLTVILVFLYTIPGAQFSDALWVSLVLLAATPVAYIGRFDFLKNEVSIVVFFLTLAFIFTLTVVGLTSSYFLELMNRRNFIQRLIIEREEERSYTLLLNTLPASIADRLMRGETIADYFPSISVLFADIVDFTPLATRMAPVEVVQFLNQVFSTFDELTEARTLEKIKTVGDAYMVVSGLPIPRSDHAEVMAELALEMQAAIANMILPNVSSLQVRIGIHTGPVIAGVIGWRKFAYDLWGDTVNTASRMETHGLPGKIQVSKAYYELLKGKYNFEERGEIDVKGKGKMRTFFLTGRLE
ncbi:MAG: adenylate/guanylate cyclase with and sensor [Chloroflexi bacterium]|nr:adenylate/guanylate cyclase with and sensor [Chloroflexota bacterium]